MGSMYPGANKPVEVFRCGINEAWPMEECLDVAPQLMLPPGVTGSTTVPLDGVHHSVVSHMGVPLDGVLLGIKAEVRLLRLVTPFVRKLVEDNILVWGDGLKDMWIDNPAGWRRTATHQKIFGPDPTGTPRNRGPV